MNSEITLTSYSVSDFSKGQVRLLYKRNDPRNAMLLEDDVPRYFLATSDDGVSKVEISDTAQKTVAKVNRGMIASDVFKFPGRNNGKAVKVANLLRKAPSTRDGQKSMALHTDNGIYYWRKRHAHHWALYPGNSSCTPVAWTESVAGSPPTWTLVVDGSMTSVLDYVLVSLFYMKSEPESGDASGWEKVDARAVWLATK